MNCEFKQVKENTYQCENCGVSIESIYGPELFSMECSYDPEREKNMPEMPEENNSSTPSFLQMAKNMGSSVVNHAMNSFQSVPANVKEERMSICEGCEHYNSETTRCNECGCFINIKADWASEKCPIDKWDMWTSGQSGGCGGCGKK
jgi:hypothetical protein